MTSLHPLKFLAFQLVPYFIPYRPSLIKETRCIKKVDPSEKKVKQKKVTEIDQIFYIPLKVEWEYFQLYRHFPSEIDIVKFKHSIMKKTTAWFFVTFCHFFLRKKVTHLPTERHIYGSSNELLNTKTYFVLWSSTAQQLVLFM